MSEKTWLSIDEEARVGVARSAAARTKTATNNRRNVIAGEHRRIHRKCVGTNGPQGPSARTSRPKEERLADARNLDVPVERVQTRSELVGIPEHLDDVEGPSIGECARRGGHAAHGTDVVVDGRPVVLVDESDASARHEAATDEAPERVEGLRRD